MRRKIMRVVGLLFFALPLMAKSGGKLCDLSPVVFEGDELYKALQLMGADSHPISSTFFPKRAEFSFSGPRKVPAFEHSVVDVTVRTKFDAQGVYDQYYSLISSRVPDVGCSSRTVHTINWVVTDGSWLGHFHVKHVDRACFHVPFDGDAQIDRATYEIDFYNKVTPVISADRKHILPRSSDWSSSNVPDIVKAIAQPLGALVQIVTLGMVPQADVQIIDGWQGQETALRMMSQYEVSYLHTVSVRPQETGTYTADFLFTSAAFSSENNRPILSVQADQNPGSLPSEGQACAMKEALEQMKTQAEHLSLNGSEYRVQRGDSLWKIANQIYGNGRYQLLICATNDLVGARADKLVVGQKLVIKPLAFFTKNSTVVLVSRGDTLWRIAKSKSTPSLPLVMTYGMLRVLNSASLRNPNLIYPMQVLQINPFHR